MASKKDLDVLRKIATETQYFSLHRTQGVHNVSVNISVPAESARVSKLGGTPIAQEQLEYRYGL